MVDRIALDLVSVMQSPDAPDVRGRVSREQKEKVDYQRKSIED